MEISVLGPLEVRTDDGAVDLRGPQARRLLSLFVLTPGQEVTVDRLVEGLWGDYAPPAAQTTLQSHVARLRKALPRPEAIRRGTVGYAIDIASDDLDAMRFEREIARGTSLLGDGLHREASVALAGALNLWRGTPYAEFSDAAALKAESDRLDQLRLDALERRITADVSGTPGGLLVAELEALVRWYPLRENLWALLMFALYRAGRQADALSAFGRARETLADELGVDPGPALREMQQRVLQQDPGLDVTHGLSALPLASGRSYAAPVTLVERATHIEELTARLDAARTGFGQLVLVHGEAGAGKTALVREFVGREAGESRVLWGSCDPLSSPRPLGPLIDVAPQLDRGILDRLRSDERSGVFDATLAALVAGGPTVLVLEDLHWADESTRDWVRFLARRINTAPCLVIATYRDEQLDASNPLRVMLGDVASQRDVSRLPVPPLSREAVSELASGAGVDAAALYDETGGNAFFVAEVIASGGQHLPVTVQDAVLARVHRLSDEARATVEAAAVIGSRIEPTLLESMPDVAPVAVDECVAAGMLRFDPPVYTFRHELARQAVLASIPQGRLRALHAHVLERLRTMLLHPKPLARLAEHAEMAGDASATLEFAIAAGDAAARLESHREAAFQYGRALPFAELLDVDARISLLRKRAEECDLSDRLFDAVEAGQLAVDLLRVSGDDLELARALLQLGKICGAAGESTRSSCATAEALEILELLPPGQDLASAYASRAAWLMVRDEFQDAIMWAERALELADRCGAEEAAILALNTIGTSRAGMYGQDGEAILRESMRRAEAAGLHQGVAHGYVNLTYVLECYNRLDDALAASRDGMAYAEEHDLHSRLLCMMSADVYLKAEVGRWDEAIAEAENLLYVRVTERVSRFEPLMDLAVIGARRGDRDDVWSLLDEASEVICGAKQIQYDGPVAIARAEVHLLEGDSAAAIAELIEPYAEARRIGSGWHIARLALWLRRCGALDEVPETEEEAERLAMTGRHREAAALWDLRGRRYEAAWARLDSDDEDLLLKARETFSSLGARVLVERTDAKLRSIGARVPRGVRSSTSRNVAGLTDREVEVLALLDEGLRNAEIADRLFLSEKTVGNHVSAILAKLGASSRLEAVRRARDLSAVG